MARIWGREPPKRGGAGYRADPQISNDQGALTCGACKGTGTVVKEVSRVDDDGDTYTEFDEKKCGTCGGSGTVRR